MAGDEGREILHRLETLCMTKRGVALVYVLLVTVVLSILATALAFSYQRTVRALLYDERNVRARELADSAVELALVLLRDHALDWYTAFPPTITSEALGYTEDRLGGRFELRMESLKELYPVGQGTYLTLVATGIAQGQQARTVANVKLSTPLTNFVFYSSGSYTLGPGGTINGPIFAGANGDGGDIRMWHDQYYFHAQRNRPWHSYGKLNLNAQLKASGKIYIRNIDSVNNRYSQPEKTLDGVVSAGDLVHDDLSDVPAKGAVSIASGLQAQPNIRVGVDLPKMSEILGNFRAKKEKTVLDISNYPNGVMAEFIDGQLIVSEAKPKVVGHVFDKDLYLASGSSMIADVQANSLDTLSAGEADTLLRSSVVWDDPDLPNLPYPPDLHGDLDSDGQSETEGDATPITRITRGDELLRVQLSRSEYSTLQLLTSRTDYPDATGQLQAPPLYLRGHVEGKVNLIYDVSDDQLDPKFDRLHTVVLADHEDPSDSERKLTAPDSPGVPGGLRYQDARIAKSPSDTEVSPDLLMVVSRGSISGSGNSMGFKSRARDLEGNLINYDQQLNTLNRNHSDYYLSKGNWPANDFSNTRGNTATVSMYGVFIGSRVSASGTRTAAGSLVSTTSRAFPTTGSNYRWSHFGSTPVGAQADQLAVLPLRQRNASTTSGTWIQLRGSMSSLFDRLRHAGGDNQYDYKLQNLDSKVLRQEMGLPVSVILCTWQRL